MGLQVDDIDESVAPLLREHVSLVPVENEAILLEQGVGVLHQLNASAAAFVALFDGVATLAELIDAAADVFDADRAAIAEDVLSMTKELGAKGLLTNVESTG